MVTLCLNMIVKNESKVIIRALESVVNIIDCFVICDTGSTDNTVQLIKDFFSTHNISGILKLTKFEDFEPHVALDFQKDEDATIAVSRKYAEKWLGLSNHSNSNSVFDDITATVGGETGIDIHPTGADKSQVLTDFSYYDTITFYGDAMFDGGNDWPLATALVNGSYWKGKAVLVKDWRDTWEKLKEVNSYE